MSGGVQPLGYSPCGKPLSDFNLSYSPCFELFLPVLGSLILDTGPPNEEILLKRV